MTTLLKACIVFGVVALSLGSVGIAHAADFPITLDDVAKVLGKPDQKSDDSLLYSGKIKVTKTKTGLKIAFNVGDNEALFFAAGLFTSSLFIEKEGENIISFIDDIGKSKVIGRFRVEISETTVPAGWRQVTLTLKK
jgi:hypothetical protein